MSIAASAGLRLELARIFLPIRPRLDAVEKRLIQAVRCDDKRLSPAFDHLEGMKGKLIRPALVFLTARAVGGVSRKHEVLAHSVELVHLASLIHDDVVDRSSMRRGHESLNARFGNERAILIGDYLFAKGLELLEELQDIEVFSRISRFISDASIGELRQMGSEFDAENAEEQYYDYIRRKTAGLFALATCLSAKLSGAPLEIRERYREFGESFGMAFQIADDCSDLFGESSDEGKPVLQDFVEGFITLPILLYFKSKGAGQYHKWRERISGGDPAELARLGQELRDRELVLTCADKVSSFVQRAADSVAALPSSSNYPLVSMAEVVLKKLSVLVSRI